MARTRTLLVASLSLFAAATACNKEGDKKAGDNKTVEADKGSAAPAATPSGSAAATPTPANNMATPPAPGAKPADQMTATPAPSTPISVNPNADDLSLLPVDSEVVLGVNWSQLSASPLWKEFVAPKMAADPKFNTGIEKFKTLCGFDPMASITSISMGLRNLGDNNKPEGAIVVHGIDRAKAMACFDKDGKAEAEKDGSKVTIEDNVVLIQKGSDPNVGFTFVNDSTALAVLGPKAATAAGVKEVAAGKGALGTSPAFVEIYNKVKTTDSVWFLMNGSSKLFTEAMKNAPMQVKIKAVFGSVNVTDGLAADVRVRFDSADQAASLAQLGKQQAAQLSMFVDKLDIAAEGADLHASAAMSNAKLHSLAAMAGMGAKHHGAPAGGGGGGGLFGPH